MVIPAHNNKTTSSEWIAWSHLLVILLITSLVCGGIWFLITRNILTSLIAITVPWIIALIFTAIGVAWTILLYPLILLISKLPNKKK